MVRELSRKLERVYRLADWYDDPHTPRGAQRYESLRKGFELIVKHDWFKSLLSRERLRILDVCGGTGIGGVALAKVLKDKIEVDLWVLDLRESALRVAREFGKKELGIEVKTLLMDVRELHKLRETFDVVLMTGYSMSHFSPWEAVRIFSGFAHVLADDGLVVMEECDRHAHIFYRVGYKHILVERTTDDRVTVSIHAGYDFIRGVVARIYVDLLSRETERIDVCYWTLAELLVLLWMFFRDVDFIPVRGPYGFILAREKRGRLSLEELATPPTVLRRHQRAGA